MSRREPDDVETLGLQIPCSRCGATPKEWCLTPKRFYTDALHTARRNVIHEAMGLGYADAVHYFKLDRQRRYARFVERLDELPLSPTVRQELLTAFGGRK